MTTKDFTVKWLAYALALLPVWLMECFLLSRYPLWAVPPERRPEVSIVSPASSWVPSGR